jgi:hypothetical protein
VTWLELYVAVGIPLQMVALGWGLVFGLEWWDGYERRRNRKP